MLLYMHIPYCDSKCHYCSFNSYVGLFETKKEYMRALLKQLEFELERFGVKNRAIESIYIGGGTPSTIKASEFRDIFRLLKPYLAKDIEINTEANPNSATTKWLEGMQELGVNRVSFGVQSFNPKKLKLLNRVHSKDEAIDAIKRAKEVGFKRVSIDLIYNCFNDTKELLKEDIDLALSLGVEHISAYELTIEKNSLFESKPFMHQENEELAKFVFDYILKSGLRAYEVSNFGEPCRHNLGYWRLKDYIGVGAGAVGFLKSKRFYPLRDIKAYIKEPTNCKIEHLSQSDLKVEKLLLGLRSIVGFESSILNKDELARAKELIDNQILYEKEARYFAKDMLLADEIALFILDTD